MKNFHKVRGKREFLFDDKELFMLGGGAVMICLLLFVLGFMTGQSFEQQGVASPLTSGETYSAENFGLDDEHAASEDALTGDAGQTATSPGVSAPSSRSGQSYFTVLSSDKEVYVEVEATPVKAPEPQPEAEEPSTPAVQAPQEPQPDASNVIQEEDIPEPPANGAATQPQTVAVASVPASLPNVPRDPSDEIRVGRQPQPTRQVPLGMNEPLPEGTIYSVQVASSPRREDAERLVQRFGQFGYQAYVMVADLAEKGVWYRVRVGNLSTRPQADKFRAELMNKTPELVNSPYVIKVAE